MMTGTRRFQMLLLSACVAFGLSAGACARAHADGVKFSATVDRSQISVDESITLKFTIQSNDGAVADPKYSAPDFQLLNQYNAVSSESYYDSSTGQIGMHNSFEVNKVLKPLKTGTFKISNIHVTVDGKLYRAPDVEVEVTSGGGGTPPPPGYGGAGVGLRGASKRDTLPSVFVRAEVDKNKVYKGQQVVVSYYIYERTRAFNIEITKFPTLNGFLREELEMPYLNRTLQMQQVVLDGVAYVRALLVRYAAYPLQSGKLNVDPMEIKYNYYEQNGSDDNDDPFAGLFRQALPGNSSSEIVPIQVMPLPTQGKPDDFSGGVGEFDVASTIDKTEVHANQPVTLTVTVQGRGNVASLEKPKAQWPSSVELYDTKGTVKSNKGVGQKTFEFLLIPRKPGVLQLPSLQFNFFDPKKGKYVTKATDPISINVLDPLPGSESDNSSVSAPVIQGPGASTQAPQATNEPRGLKLPGESADSSVLSGLPMWRWIYRLSLAAFALFLLLVGRDLLQKFRNRASQQSALRAKQEAKSWARLHSLAGRMAGGMPWNEVIVVYDTIAAQVHDAIDRVYAVGSRSYSREELRRMLVDERGMPETVWQRAEKVLEFAELVRFASSAGAVSESAARGNGPKWVSEAELVARLIEHPS